MNLMKLVFRHGKLWFAIAWFGVALLVYLSVVKSTSAVALPHADKLGHVVAYAVLTFWFMQLYEGTRSRIFVASGILALGVSLEVVQYWTGYRTMEAADALADAVGIALGWLVGPPRTFNVLERVERAL